MIEVIYCDSRQQARDEVRDIKLRLADPPNPLFVLTLEGADFISRPILKCLGIVRDPNGLPGSTEYCGHPCEWGVKVEVKS